VERSGAEAIYGEGREVVVVVLLRMDEQIRKLEERVARVRTSASVSLSAG
jgi:hypothetical protein